MVREDLADLKAMAQQYPWFSGARLLQAAGERLSGQVMGDETLRTAAAHLPSRSVLFDLANQVSRPAPAPLRVVHAEPVAAPSPVLPAAEEATPALTAAPVEPPTEPVALQHAEPAVASVVDEPVIPEMLVEAAPIEVPAPSIEALPVPEPEAPEPVLPEPEPELAPVPEESTDALEAEYVKSALAQAYDLTWQEQLEATSGPRRPEPEPVPEPKPVSPPPAAEQAATPMPAARTASKLRFTDWLDEAASGSAPVPLAAATPPPAEPAAAVPPPAPKTSSESLDPKALIDRFIRQQPADIPPRPAFFTPQQAAKKSLDDSSGIVTETLARIYEQQGNFGKAMEAYRRLALKYPEKSAYFAALSKALEDKQTP